MEDKKNFATTGTESFKIDGQEPAKEKIVINIQEEKPSVGIILDKSGLKNTAPTGNAFVDWYRSINRFFISHSGVNIKEKANFFHLLSVMINSGIPMIKSLQSLAAQMEKSPRLQMIINNIADDIEAGSSLSNAMMTYPKIFVDSEIGMIESGEASGQLGKVLENLANYCERAYSIKSKIKSAMIYPTVIFVLLILVVIGLMVYVVPKLKELFASAQGELPLITRIVVGTSDFIVGHYFLLLSVVIGLIAFVIFFQKTDTGRYFFDNLKLRLPIFGTLFKQAYLAKFASSLSNLLDSNVSIVDTLRITADSIGNEVYRKRLLLAVEDIKQGIPLAENLTSSDLFPPMLVNMIDVGEKTAQLDEITAKVSVFYENEVDNAISGISKIIEPVILVVIGVVVGMVVAAVMLPIMKLATLSGAL